MSLVWVSASLHAVLLHLYAVSIVRSSIAEAQLRTHKLRSPQVNTLVRQQVALLGTQLCHILLQPLRDQAAAAEAAAS